MTLKEVQKILNADVLYGEHLLDKEVKIAFACDLISEMLAFADSYALLITSLTNLHVIHTAEVMDAIGVVLVGGKRPSEEVIKNMDHGEIPLLSTPLYLFQACGLLFQNGIKGCSRGHEE
jgi:predicted transcriptional regulator